VEALYQDTLEKLNQQKEDMKNKHDSMVELYLKQRYDLQLLQREHDENDGTLTALREEKEELSAKLRDFVHKRRESREALVSNVDRATTQRILPYRKGCTIASKTAEMASYQLTEEQNMATVHLHNLENHIVKIRTKCKKLETEDKAALLQCEDEMLRMKDRIKLLQQVVAEAPHDFDQREELDRLVDRCSEDIECLQERVAQMQKNEMNSLQANSC